MPVDPNPYPVVKATTRRRKQGLRQWTTFEWGFCYATVLLGIVGGASVVRGVAARDLWVGLGVGLLLSGPAYVGLLANSHLVESQFQTLRSSVAAKFVAATMLPCMLCMCALCMSMSYSDGFMAGWSQETFVASVVGGGTALAASWLLYVARVGLQSMTGR